MLITYHKVRTADHTCLLQTRQEVRFSARDRSAGELKSWTYLRFADRMVYGRFNRILWALYDKVSAREILIHTRLSEVAYDLPSNFTKYCRQYLGDNYFDTLPEEEDEDTLTGGSAAEEYTEDVDVNVGGGDEEQDESEEELCSEDELTPVVYPEDMW